MKIKVIQVLEQVLEEDNIYFKIGDMVKVKYNIYDDEYDWIDTEGVIGKIKGFSNSDRIILDTSKEYESQSKTLLLSEITNIKKLN